MPSRVAESILNTEMNLAGKEESEKRKIERPDMHSDDFPFLAIETDGNLFPQIIQSKIEIFMLQTERLHRQLSRSSNSRKLELLIKYKSAVETKLKGFLNRPDDLLEEKEKIITETK